MDVQKNSADDAQLMNVSKKNVAYVVQLIDGKDVRIDVESMDDGKSIMAHFQTCHR